MSNPRPWKLIVASTVIFASWFVVLGVFIQRHVAEAGEAIDLRRVAQLRPPIEWQFSVLEQAGQPIGYSWTHLREADAEGRTEYELTERTKLRATLGDTTVDTALQYDARVDDRFRIESFEGTARFGGLSYALSGRVEGRKLDATLVGPEGPQSQTIELQDDLYLPLAALPYLAPARLEVGKTYTLETFNFVNFGKQTVRVRVIGREPKPLRGRSVLTTKIEVTLSGVVTNLYVNDSGERVLEETLDGSIVARAATQAETLDVDRTLKIPSPSFPRL